MYNIGDEICYPIHGAGVITGIEEKEFLNETRQYYLVNFISEGIDVLIPVDKAETSGIRPAATADEVDAMLQALKGDLGEIISKWNKRYQNNLEKLKSGDSVACARVVRDLTIMNRAKTLSGNEKHLLFIAKNFMISQIMAVRKISKNNADLLVESLIGQTNVNE